LAAIRKDDQSSAQQEASLQLGVSWCEQTDAESMQLLAALLQ
jgi:hypothetical protein